MPNKLFLVIIPLLLSWPARLQAEIITATVTSKTSATVSGDETGLVEATYSTTASTKDRLTAGSTATMKISGLPNATIDYVAVYMHSNKSSGAGSMTIHLNGVSIGAISDKPFNEWPSQTAYTQNYVPIWFNGPWETDGDAVLTLNISASANSLYLSKIEIAVSEGEQKPFTTTFSWNTSEGDLQKQITESAVGSGIVLPQCDLSSFTLEGEEWEFAGWAKDRIIAKYKTQPDMLFAGQKFYPTHNSTLFAVYKTVVEEQSIMQDTLYQSGVYALVMKGSTEYFMAEGPVADKRVKTRSCEVEMQQDGRYRLLADAVSANARYAVIFDGATIQIQHLATESGVGHTSTNLASNNELWQWREGLNHSAAIYFGAVEQAGETEAKLFMPYLLSAGDWAYEARTMNLPDAFEYILLFDLFDVPTSANTSVWTTHPFGYDAIPSVKSSSKAKKMLQKGILLIDYKGELFDSLGRKITSSP